MFNLLDIRVVSGDPCLALEVWMVSNDLCLALEMQMIFDYPRF